MNVTFYSFSKRNNSTKQPTEGGTNYNVVLKDNCTIINPILVLDFNPTNYNYAYIADFGRYYFINNWQYFQGRWEVDLTIDLLASFKATIIATNANVLYADDSTKNIVDKRIPIKADITVSSNSANVEGFPIAADGGIGAIILGITGSGSFGPYLLDDPADIRLLMDSIGLWLADSVTDLVTGFKQMVFSGSAPDNLKSAFALPIVIENDEVGGVREQLVLGGYPCAKDNGQTPIFGTSISRTIKKDDTVIAIPWSFADWRRNTPYTELFLYLPFIGCMSLPTSDLINDASLTITYSLNLTSGDLSVLVKGTQTSKIVAVASTNIAMATAYGSTALNSSKITQAMTLGAGAAVGAISAVATGGATLVGTGVGASLAGAANSIINSFGGSSSGSGGLGGGADTGLDNQIHIYAVTRALTDTQTAFNDIMGKPYMGVSAISAFTGYVQTDGFSINAGISESERTRINQMMDAGVYIE